MILTVNRDISDDISTEGKFLINNVFKYYTIERPWQNGANARGQSCFLPGTYEIIIDPSIRFGKPMPHILNVPARDGIRIHPANWANQLEGCIAIGTTRSKDAIGMSVVAFNAFMELLKIEMDAKRKVFITVNNVW